MAEVKTVREKQLDDVHSELDKIIERQNRFYEALIKGNILEMAKEFAGAQSHTLRYLPELLDDPMDKIEVQMKVADCFITIEKRCDDIQRSYGLK